MQLDKEFLDFKQFICKEAALRFLLPGEVLIEKGQKPLVLYLFEAGKLQYDNITSSTIFKIDTPFLLGLKELLLFQNYADNVIVIESTSVYEISNENFMSLFANDYLIRDKLLKLVCRNLSKADKVFE